MFSEQCQDGSEFVVQLRGPHGAPAQHVGNYEHVVLISGGIGSTPFCSIIKDSCNAMRGYVPGHETSPSSIAPEVHRGSREVVHTNPASLSPVPEDPD